MLSDDTEAGSLNGPAQSVDGAIPSRCCQRTSRWDRCASACSSLLVVRPAAEQTREETGPPPGTPRAPRLLSQPLVARGQPARLPRRHRAGRVGVPPPRHVPERSDQNVLAQRRQEAAAEGTGVGRGLAVLRPPDRPPVGLLEPRSRHAGEIVSGAGGAHPSGGLAERVAGEAYVVEPEAADQDLVAVLELVPVHALAVEEDAVQAAVVEHPGIARLAVDERVPARDGGIVEADVRRQAAAHPRPAVLERDHVDALVVLVGDVVALLDQRLARALEPLGCVHLVAADGLHVVVVLEDRGAPEAPLVTVR